MWTKVKKALKAVRDAIVTSARYVFGTALGVAGVVVGSVSLAGLTVVSFAFRGVEFAKDAVYHVASFVVLVPMAAIAALLAVLVLLSAAGVSLASDTYGKDPKPVMMTAAGTVEDLFDVMGMGGGSSLRSEVRSAFENDEVWVKKYGRPGKNA